MQGKGKRILEEGESSNPPHKRTARIRGRPYVIEWLRRMDDLDLANPPPSNEAYSPAVPIDPPSGQLAPKIEQTRVSLAEEIRGQGMIQETMNPLKSEPTENDLPLLQSDQLQQEMSWMGEFNKTTLGIRGLPLQPDRSEDSDPLQYIQEPPEEKIIENPEESEEDPEERPQEVESVEERSGENQVESGVEPIEDEAGTDEEDDEQQPNDEDEDQQDDEDDENNEQQPNDGDQQDDDGDDDGEVADEDIGTPSPTSTITTV